MDVISTESSLDGKAQRSSPLSALAPEGALRPSSAKVTRLQLDYLEGTRALAALLVVMFHAKLHVWNPMLVDRVPPAWFDLLHFPLESGRYAVSLFIVISGFCLMLPIVRQPVPVPVDVKSFYMRRARRVLPPYYASLVVVLALIYTVLGEKTGTVWDGSIPVTRTGLVSHLLLVHNWSPMLHPQYDEIGSMTMAQIAETFQAGPESVKPFLAKVGTILGDTFNINTPLWSIAIECQIYLLFPLLVALWRRIGALATVGLCFLSYLYYIPHHTPLDLFTTPHFLALFALGMLGAQVAYGVGPRWERWRGRRSWAGVGIGLWLALFLTRAFVPVVGALPQAANLIVGPASMCVLVGAARSEASRLRRFLSYRPLVFLGTFSYSIYLLHEPLLQLFQQYVLGGLADQPVLQFYALVGPGVVFVCAVAHLFFRTFERPFMSAGATHAPAPKPATA